MNYKILIFSFIFSVSIFAKEKFYIRTSVMEDIHLDCMQRQLENQLFEKASQNPELRNNPYKGLTISRIANTADGTANLKICLNWADKEYVDSWIRFHKIDIKEEYINYLNGSGYEARIIDAGIYNLTRRDCAIFEFEDNFKKLNYSNYRFTGNYFLSSKSIDLSAWNYGTRDAYDKYGYKHKDYWANDFELENEDENTRGILRNELTRKPMSTIRIGQFDVDNFSIDRTSYRNCLVSKYQAAVMQSMKKMNMSQKKNCH